MATLPAPPDSTLRQLIGSAFEGKKSKWKVFVTRSEQAAREAANRCMYALVTTGGFLFSSSGLRSVFLTHSVVASIALGAKEAMKLVLISTGAVFAVSFVYTMVSAPQEDVRSSSFVNKLTGNNKTLWSSVLEVMESFNEVLQAFPLLINPRMDYLHKKVPAEVLLRLLTAASTHKYPSTAAAGEGSVDDLVYRPERAAAAVRAGDAILESVASKVKGSVPGVAGAEALRTDDSSPETAASDETVEDLRFWIEYAEAAYNEMGSEDAIDEWLQARGWELLLASYLNNPSAPVFFAACSKERKELLVAIRGTMSLSDVVTDIIVKPETWGDADVQVHSGIGAAATQVFRRVHTIASAFVASGHSVVVVGHSLGAGAAALLSWLLRERTGIQPLRAYAFATPACASARVADMCREYVTSVVMRNDAVPRLAPRAAVALQEELLGFSMEELSKCAADWGPLGQALLRSVQQAGRDQAEAAAAPTPAAADSDVDTALLGPSDDDDEGDTKSAPEAMLLPVVPGRIVLLRPKSDEVEGAVTTPSTLSEPVGADSNGADKDADAAPSAAGPSAPEFERVMIEHDALTLGCLRICPAALEDHFLDQYRLGLGLQPYKATQTMAVEDTVEDAGLGGASLAPQTDFKDGSE